MDVRLVDWKRTANLDRKYVNPWRSLAAPLEHLADAQGVKYRLQLNLYWYILETYYQYVVSAMLVVCVHPDLEAPFIDEVPHMPVETCAIMRLRRQAVANHAEISPTFAGCCARCYPDCGGEVSQRCCAGCCEGCCERCCAGCCAGCCAECCAGCCAACCAACCALLPTLGTINSNL